MTRRTNARIAGFTFLLYIAAGITGLVLSGRATRGDDIAARLASVAQHQTELRVVVMLDLLTAFCALVLGVTLFSWLLLRGRMVPAALARLGVFASALLVVVLPLQLAGLLGGIDWFGVVTWLVWLPALVFELWLAAWLLVKGVAAPARSLSA